MSKRDAEQVQKVLSGDQAAYEPLVKAYQGRIYAFVAGRTRNFSATEDIVQNAFVEAYMHLKSLKSPEKFSGWLRGIALNLSNKWLQQKRPIISIDDTSRDITPEVSELPLPDLPDEALEKNRNKRSRYSRRGCTVTHLSGISITSLHGRHDLSRKSQPFSTSPKAQ